MSMNKINYYNKLKLAVLILERTLLFIYFFGSRAENQMFVCPGTYVVFLKNTNLLCNAHHLGND